MMMLTFVLIGGCVYSRAMYRVKRVKILEHHRKLSKVYYDQSGTFSLCFPRFFSVFTGVDKLKKL